MRRVVSCGCNRAEQHCESVGRDYESIHHTALTLCIIGDTDEQARALIDRGPFLAEQARESWTQAAVIFGELGDGAQAAQLRAELATSGIS